MTEQYTKVKINDDNLPLAQIIPISTNNNTNIVLSSADFYRTEFNTNILLTASPGIEFNNIFQSAWFYLPLNTFNAVQPTPEIDYPTNNKVRLITNMTYLHEIMIQFKLSKLNNNNFINRRELRVNLVDDNDNIYNQSLFYNIQPNSGEHAIILIKGYIIHNALDIIRLRFMIVQDNDNNDVNDTLLTIFRISWVVQGS